MTAKLPRKTAKRRSSVDDTSDLVQRVGADRAAFLVDRVARSADAAVAELDDARVRVALDLLLDMFRPVTIAEAAVRPHPDFCPNCDTRSERKKLFCSELCNQEAQLIRYIRRVERRSRRRCRGAPRRNRDANAHGSFWRLSDEGANDRAGVTRGRRCARRRTVRALWRAWHGDRSYPRFIGRTYESTPDV
jgi:hypothetical protein